MAGERYALYGVITEERDFNEAGDFDKQSAGEGDELIYETDSTEEARQIYEAGGFERSGKWHAVTRVVDNHKSLAPHTFGTPSKRDYDQS